MEEEDDDLVLPADTLKALGEFRAEKDARQRQFEDLKATAEDAFRNGTKGRISMDLFGEDWNSSQFWYTDATAAILARQLLKETATDSAIAIVSAPSVYVALRNILSENESSPRPKLCLLEYDKRFEIFGSDFVPYDYNHPLRVPNELKSRFDRIICDPPFLSEDCQVKTALTVRSLATSWKSSNEGGNLRFIACTGERMESTVQKIYGAIGAQTTTFNPQHSKGLSNEFRCYANFECEDWFWNSR